MTTISTMITLPGKTEEAFNFYKSVFGTDFHGEIMRWSDMPAQNGHALSDADKKLVMHIELPIADGYVLMGADDVGGAPAGFKTAYGNNIAICLNPDTKAEADRLFHGLSAGGNVTMPMTNMFWGDYYGDFTDQYGVRWMINCAGKSTK